MLSNLIESNLKNDDDKLVNGVAIGQVVSKSDIQSIGRVQVALPWLDGQTVWARVASPMAGLNYGTYFIPQAGTEVVLAFDGGDVNSAVVIGSLWNQIDRSPGKIPSDPTTTRKISTPTGHEIAFEELTQSISITTNTQQKIVLDPSGVRINSIGGGGTSASFDAQGNITLSATSSINLKAPTINIDAATTVNIRSSVSTNVNGGGKCKINAGLVEIN